MVGSRTGRIARPVSPAVGARGGAGVHYKDVKGILSPKGGMDLYRGCTHGCIYCDSLWHLLIPDLRRPGRCEWRCH